MTDLEPKYTLYDNREQMLTSATLSKLLSQPVFRVDCQPLNGHSGLAGGQLNYVDTDAGRFVLKRMSIASDWIMFSSSDEQCRAVRLWQYGLLDQLSPHLEHKMIACAQDREGWALLMQDLTGDVFAWDQPMAPELVPVFLDALARLHAAFWNDPRLNDGRLGLCDATTLLDQTSLSMAQKYQELSLGVLPGWVVDGWEVMGDLLDPDVFNQMLGLNENPQPLIDALNRDPYTLLHGDYRAENLAHPNYPVAIDWQEASCSLMTIDLAWFIKHGYVQEALGEEEAVRYHRNRLQAYLNRTFEDRAWQRMVDLGYLVDALRIASIEAYWYKHSETQEGRGWNERAVKKRNQQVRAAMRWL